MKKTILLTIIISLFMSAFVVLNSALAADWKKVSDNLWIDLESVDYISKFGTYRLWSKWENPNYGAKDIVLPDINSEDYCNNLLTDGEKEACLAEREKKITKVRSTKTIMVFNEFNCKKHQYKTLDTVLLNSKNEILERKTSIIPKAFWANVVPETVSQYQYDEVCKE